MLLLAAAAASAGNEKPLPTSRSRILNERGVTYVVEGRRTIPWGCEISIAREVTIVGKGDAVLEVAGSLQIHGVDGFEVTIKGVRIEPAPMFEQIRLDKVIFVQGGGVLADGKKPVRGSIVVENTDFAPGVRLDVAMTGGQVLLLNAMFREPARILAARTEGKRNALKVSINGCYYHPQIGDKSNRAPRSGFLGGLFLTGVSKGLVRNSRLAGDKSLFLDCPDLTFDGNKVNSTELVFQTTVAGGLGRTKVQKCDIYSNKLVFRAPPRASKQRILVDKCWFRDLTRAKDVDARIVVDGKDDEDCGAVATLKSIKKKPLQLAGKR